SCPVWRWKYRLGDGRFRLSQGRFRTEFVGQSQVPWVGPFPSQTYEPPLSFIHLKLVAETRPWHANCQTPGMRGFRPPNIPSLSLWLGTAKRRFYARTDCAQRRQSPEILECPDLVSERIPSACKPGNCLPAWRSSSPSGCACLHFLG